MNYPIIKDQIKVTIKSNAYTGINIRAFINDTPYILNNDNIINLIEKEIKQKNYSTNKQGHQRFSRMIINKKHGF